MKTFFMITNIFMPTALNTAMTTIMLTMNQSTPMITATGSTVTTTPTKIPRLC